MTFGRSSFPNVSDIDGEKVSDTHFVRASISYTPRDAYPKIHWDAFPKFTVTDENQLDFFLIESTELDTFRDSETVVAYKDITEQNHYQSLDGPTVVPKNEIGEITTGIDSSVRAKTHPELPAVFKSDGTSVTVRTGSQRTAIEVGQKESIQLSDRAITAIESGEKTENVATPILTVENYGSVDVYGPPQEVLDQLN